MSNRSCCFTGHRKISYAEMERLQADLPAEIERLAGEGYTSFYAGGALGFDTCAARAVLLVRERRPEIKLRLLLPCAQQDRNWSLREKRIYREILNEADTYEYISIAYSAAAMMKRNRELVDRSDYCLCYLAQEQGGTAFTVRYARKKGIEVRNLFEF